MGWECNLMVALKNAKLILWCIKNSWTNWQHASSLHLEGGWRRIACVYRVLNKWAVIGRN